MRDKGDTSASLTERLWRRVVKTDGRDDSCWLWTGAHNPSGYGTINPGPGSRGNKLMTHRVSWELMHGPITHGQTVDHLCGMPLCVNPLHMRLASQWENILRGKGPSSSNRAKTHCLNGHEFSPANTYNWHGHRFCRICRRERGAS